MTRLQKQYAPWSEDPDRPEDIPALQMTKVPSKEDIERLLRNKRSPQEAASPPRR
jgi:hypothetical protein